jgi:hypothetical protein
LKTMPGYRTPNATISPGSSEAATEPVLAISTLPRSSVAPTRRSSTTWEISLLMRRATA